MFEIFAFHPELALKRVIIELSFGHSIEKLLTLDYQLRDAAYIVISRKDKLAISTMFKIEIKFAVAALQKWFNAKIESKE